jgi:flavin-dependent dehydrogenase
LVSLCGNTIETAFSTRFKEAKKLNNGYTVTLLQNGQKTEVTTDIIIGADGANSRVRKTLLPSQKKSPKRYISIQEWFPNTDYLNQYVAIFDQKVSDFYSWIIPKDGGMIFGTAIEEGKDAVTYHNLQKERLKKYGYHLNIPTKKEGCYLLRPYSSKEVQLGKDNIALVGEAAGFISPTSAEGISYAMVSADMLSHAIIENKTHFLSLYEHNVKPLKKNIDLKMKKYPIMYNQTIRKWVLQSSIGAIKVNKLSLLSSSFISLKPSIG